MYGNLEGKNYFMCKKRNGPYDIQHMNFLVSCLSNQVFTYIITVYEGMLRYLTLFQNNWIQHITDTKTIRDTTLPAVETAKVGGEVIYNIHNLIWM